MRIAGLPVWALVLAACVLVPFAVQLWIDAERRRAKERTRRLLQRLDRVTPIEGASGPPRAASEGTEPSEGDEMDHAHPQHATHSSSIAPRARGAPDS